MKKYAPPPERDRLPPMFEGDKDSAPAALVPTQAGDDADVPRFVTQGASMERWVFLGPALLMMLIAGLSVADASPGEGGTIWGVTAVCALAGWLAHQHIVKHRKEFRLTDKGLEVEVRHQVGGEPRVTRIPWSRMRVYTAVHDADEALLYVVDDRGDTVTLNERPPRSWASDFIQRFVEQARLHGIAERPALPTQPEYQRGEGMSPLVRVVLWVWVLLFIMMGDPFSPSPGSKIVGITTLVLAALAFGLWHTLDDADVAYRDLTSPRLMARLRRWLRKVLGMRVV